MGKVRMGIRALAAEGKWEEKQAKYSSIRVFTTMECMANCLKKSHSTILPHYGQFLLWDPTKKGHRALHVYSIATLVASWLKWLQIILNDFSWIYRHIETHLGSFQIIWSHLRPEATKLAKI